jgi:REP element-mobilizing transposase RayT
MAKRRDAQRRSIRLKGYDYSQPGAYFVTLCTQNREFLFGEIANDTMLLNSYGKITEHEWLRSADVRAEVELDVFVVMPNHVHGIVWINKRGAVDATRRAHGRAPLRRKPGSLGSMVAGFKSGVTRRVNALRCSPGGRVWQRNYYERIVRDEDELKRIRQYITDNPIRWALDDNNPAKLKRNRSAVGAHGVRPGSVPGT